MIAAMTKRVDDRDGRRPAEACSRPRYRIALVLGALVLNLVIASAPHAAITTYSGYLADVQPTLDQWWNALESWQGHHFLLAPLPANTDTGSEMAALLGQWWSALEAKRGFHFLLQPTLGAIDTKAELYQVLSQWQNALEAWRGFHFLLEPPAPPTISKTGTFRLTPRHAAVQVGESFTFELVWTVPDRRGWRDLDTIDIRICGDENPVLSVRWDELSNTFSVFDGEAGQFSTPAVPGSNTTLQGDGAVLLLADSAAEGSGPEGTSVTLTLSLVMTPAAAGRSCAVEAAATDDLGNEEPFKRAGKIDVGE
jgi:hypothetical protein